MLHVFNVNYGDMLTFDVNLAMERVLDLKNAISQSQHIPVEEQVMLISSGQSLRDGEVVSSYAAGTETNPVYLFDKACIENSTPPELQSVHCGNDFAVSVPTALSLRPCYKTIQIRTKLAISLQEISKEHVKHLKGLVQDNRLMFQGWQSAVSNLREMVAGFQKRLPQLISECQTKLQQVNGDSSALDGMEDILDMLQEIPILPPLLKYGRSTSLSQVQDHSQVSLLHWIEANCKDVSLRNMLKECEQKQKQLSAERLKMLFEECTKAEAKANNNGLIEVSRINDRFVRLENFVDNSQKIMNDQEVITRSFLKNWSNAGELQNHSSGIDALQTLCESHINQLKLMVDKETTLRDYIHICMKGKSELATKLHQRLRWLHGIQKGINQADTQLCLFLQKLTLLEQQKQFFVKVKLAPALYLSSLTEVVRRKRFANEYLQWANKAVADALVERDREIMKRKTFQSNLSGHFIQKLFQGFADKPPSLSKRPLRSFDSDLPDITEEQLDKLSKQLPSFKNLLQVSFADSSMASLSFVPSTQTSSLTTLSEETSEQMEGTTPPELPSMSVTHSHTDSFAVVNSASKCHNQNSDFAESPDDDAKLGSLEQSAGNPLNDDDRDIAASLPQRAHSTVTLTDEPISPAVSNSSSGAESQFPRFGDDSLGSPPDSEFFSIVPSTGSVAVPENFESPTLSRRRNSVVNIGSVDSNSFQKVDGLSSDDEMFHSITDEHQDHKNLRKKLIQLQSDYDKLVEVSSQEKEDLNLLIKKQLIELDSQRIAEKTLESDFDKRWNDSRTELDNLIKQLENETSERQKAWTKNADLEKKLMGATKDYVLLQGQLDKITLELSAKNTNLEKLESDFAEQKHLYETALSDKEWKVQEITTLKLAMEKIEKKVSLDQLKLAKADDRIQELEDLLLDRDHKEQEDAQQVLVYEAKINELSDRIKVAFESQQKSSYEKDEACSKIAQSQTALLKANEEIYSLRKMIVDYETDISNDRKKDQLLRDFKSQQKALEEEKSNLEQEMRELKSDLQETKEELRDAEAELESIDSKAAQDMKSYQEQLSEIKSAHLEEQKALSQEHDNAVVNLKHNFEMEIQELRQSTKNAAFAKEQEMRKLIEETCVAHRNEMDEHEADRLAELAAVKQQADIMKQKLEENDRKLEHEKDKATELINDLHSKINELEGRCFKLTQDNDQLLLDRTSLEHKLLEAKNKSVSERSQRQSSSSTQEKLDDDDETKSKRSKVDDGSFVDGSCSSVDAVHSKAGNSDMILAHQNEIEYLKEKFNKDKIALENFYRRKEEESAKRRQIVFNTAIQQASAAKDLEIKTLKEKLMVQSQMIPSTTLSMAIPSQQMATSMTQPAPCSLSTSVQSSVSMQMSFSQSESPNVSVDSTRDKDRVTVANFQPGDTVLVCYNDSYQQFTLFTTSRTLHFIHQDSVKDLALGLAELEAKKTMTFAVVLAKEYCQARKAQNRFGVPVNTKFYRVKVSPMSKKE